MIGLLCVICCVFYFYLTNKEAEVHVYELCGFLKEDKHRATPSMSNLSPTSVLLLSAASLGGYTMKTQQGGGGETQPACPVVGEENGGCSDH